MQNLGTPKTLDGAILNGVATSSLADIEKNLHAHIKDFIAQKFNVAMLQAEKRAFTPDDLKNLFDQLVRKG